MNLTRKLTREIKKEQIKAVLIHGFNSNLEKFKELKRILKEKGVKVYSVSYSSYKNYREWLREIENQIRKIEDKHNVYVVGHSLGGSLAIYLCRKYKFKGIITINSPIYLKNQFLLNLFLKFFKKKNIREVTIKKAKYSVGSIESLFEFLKKIKDLRVWADSALIIQSKKDKLVSPKSAKVIYENIIAKNKVLMNVGYGHNPLTQQSVINSIISFIGLA